VSGSHPSMPRTRSKPHSRLRRTAALTTGRRQFDESRPASDSQTRQVQAANAMLARRDPVRARAGAREDSTVRRRPARPRESRAPGYCRRVIRSAVEIGFAESALAPALPRTRGRKALDRDGIGCETYSAWSMPASTGPWPARKESSSGPALNRARRAARSRPRAFALE